MIWPKSFSFEFKPLEFFCLIFNRSSIKPKIPKLIETKITIKIYILLRSAHKKVPEKIPNIIINPPMVGVPDFFIMWSIGPSCLIGPDICFFWNIFIKGSPIKKTIMNDVITERPVLNVIYLKTLRNE